MVNLSWENLKENVIVICAIVDLVFGEGWQCLEFEVLVRVKEEVCVCVVCVCVCVCVCVVCVVVWCGVVCVIPENCDNPSAIVVKCVCVCVCVCVVFGDDVESDMV